MSVQDMIEKVGKSTDLVLREANEYQITTDQEFENISKFYLRIRELKEQIESTFGIIKKKTYEAYKEAGNQYKKFTDPLLEAERVINQKTFAYKRQKELEKKVEVEKAIEKAVETNTPVVVTMVDAPVVPKVDGLSSRKNWKFKITDATKLPREYLMPDEKAIGAVVRALKDKTKIEGVEVYFDETLIKRAGND